MAEDPYIDGKNHKEKQGSNYKKIVVTTWGEEGRCEQERHEGASGILQDFLRGDYGVRLKFKQHILCIPACISKKRKK